MSVTSLDPPQLKTPSACKLHSSLFYRIGSYCRLKFYIAGIGIFELFGSCDLDLMTFIYELDPYSVEIYRLCKNELPTSRLSRVIIRHYIHTYRHNYNYYTRVFAGGKHMLFLNMHKLRTLCIGTKYTSCVNLHCILI